MNHIYIKARAKINLTLNVLDKRDDGYHNIESIFQRICLYDKIHIYKIKNDEFILETNISEINNKENIIYKAYIELKNRYNQISGIKVKLNKRIPMQAGLGGGSADCASFILAMNKLFKLNLSEVEMIEIGEKLGSDVVPCFYNQVVKAEGKGNIISKINSKCQFHVLIIKPDFTCSTVKMYQKFDDRYIEQNYNSHKMIDALRTGDIFEISQNLYNVFEQVIEKKELINKIKIELEKNGAIGSLMCGSGSCVFGIFCNKKQIKKAYKKLKKTYDLYMCLSYNNRNR